MRLLLVHNPKAGQREHSAGKVAAALRQAGFEVDCGRHEEVHWPSVPKRFDLVLVAGGDGTVGKTACELVGRNIPLSVLPLGTANNLARTLGFVAPLDDLIARLRRGRNVPFDVGRARGPWGVQYFFEGTGSGLIANYLRQPEKVRLARHSKSAELRQHRRELVKRLRVARAVPWEMEIDGEDCSGSYLFWHALNIRSVGPALVLARGAKTDDGLFNFVALAEEKRSAVIDYVKTANDRRPFPVAPKKFRSLRLVWNGKLLHFDDRFWPHAASKSRGRAKIMLEVQAGALRIWK